MSNSVDKLYDIVYEIKQIDNMYFDQESKEERLQILLNELEGLRSEMERCGDKLKDLVVEYEIPLRLKLL